MGTSGRDANAPQIDYYGVLQDVIALEYDAHTVVLFRCDWFDILNGVKVDHKHGLVEVKHTSRLATYEPFVLAAQATQVCYLPYASQKPDRRQWWVAFKTNQKSRFHAEGDDSNLEFYQDERPDNPISVSDGPDFDWDGMVLGENDFELVDERTVLPPTTSAASQSMARDENHVDEGEEEHDREQENHMEQGDEEDLLSYNDSDEEY